MVTGYYEPLLRGSRTRTSRYRYPIYARAAGPAGDRPLARSTRTSSTGACAGASRATASCPTSRAATSTRTPRRSRGSRSRGWTTRSSCSSCTSRARARSQLENGERMRVGYADQNGHPVPLARRGCSSSAARLPPERASMQGIKDWARRHPRKVQQFLNANPELRVLPRAAARPARARSARSACRSPPSARSRSTRASIPLGVPVYLATTWPNTAEPLNRLMVAQDTGGAIAGGVRADFFWGFGDAAGNQAGKMRQAGPHVGAAAEGLHAAAGRRRRSPECVAALRATPLGSARPSRPRASSRSSATGNRAGNALAVLEEDRRRAGDALLAGRTRGSCRSASRTRRRRPAVARRVSMRSSHALARSGAHQTAFDFSIESGDRIG